MKLNKLSALMILGGAFVVQAHAGMVRDSHGNVGYDTAAECDAAVQSGQARFYEPATKMPTLKRKGEKTVRTARLSDVGSQYALGACDVGVGRGNARNGVAKALVGKYVPYSPAMAVNLYANASGEAVRVSMAKCDNRFSAVMPRAVPAAPAPVAVAPAPVVVAPAAAPVVVAAAPAPMPVAAPVVAAAPASRMSPYLFGTFGAQRDLIGNDAIGGIAQHDDHSTKGAVQAGVGYQFDNMWGAEAFAQGGTRHVFENGARSSARALGLRATIGQEVATGLRVFGKLGVARVTHTGDFDSQSQTRPTVGLGMTYDLSKNLALRGDFDHFVKKNTDNRPNWKALNYIGLGLQYSFMP